MSKVSGKLTPVSVKSAARGNGKFDSGNLVAPRAVSQLGKLPLLAALTGLLVGGLAYVLYTATAWMLNRFLGGWGGIWGMSSGTYSHTDWFASGEAGGRWWLAILIPTVGGLVLAVWQKLSRDRHGAGIDTVIDAFHNNRGKLPGKLAFTKLVSSTISIGTGASGGREGPIALIGASVGSWLSGRFNLTVRERRILLAAGLAAGVGGMFRAPLAGGLLAAEIMYSDSEFEPDVLMPSIIASVCGYCVFGLMVGFDPIFGQVSADYRFVNPLELVSLTALAGVLVIGGWLSVAIYHAVKRRFSGVNPFLRPAIGALLTGLVTVGAWAALGFRGEVFALLGDGYHLLVGLFSGAAGAGPGAWWLLLLIAFGKMVTTALTIGSGNATGSFAPSMMIGACIGGGMGLVLKQIMPESLMPALSDGQTAAAFAIVGMAGFYSGVAKAPIAIVIIVSELTGSYHLLIPTLWVGTLTFLGARFYRLHLPQVPTRLESKAHMGDFAVNVLESITVRDVLKELGDFETISGGTTVHTILSMGTSTRQSYYPVVNASGAFIGIFSLNDLRAVLDQQEVWDLLVAADVMKPRAEIDVVSPDETLADVSMRFARTSLEELPVVDGDQLVGVISRRQLNNAYIRRMMVFEGARVQERTRVIERDPLGE